MAGLRLPWHWERLSAIDDAPPTAIPEQALGVEVHMQAAHNAQIAFYLTGQQTPELDGVAALGLRPALFAYRSNLAELRYDFPLALLPGRDDAAAVASLSALVDAALAVRADGPEHERLCHNAYTLERELRQLLAEQGGGGRYGALRAAAAERLAANADPGLNDSMRTLATVLPQDAELLDCCRATPRRVVTHLWTAAQRARLQDMRAQIERLAQKVADVLDAARLRSDAGQTPEALRAAIGTAHAAVFDFVAFSRVLGRGAAAPDLPETRRRRLQWLLSVLRGQRFFADPTPTEGAKSAYTFSFTSCAEALRAWRERLPRAIELLKAMAIAELEIAGEYDEARHDPVFAGFGTQGLEPSDIARFPSYLVHLDASRIPPGEAALALEAMDAGLPIKMLLQTDDILAPAALGEGGCSLGIANRQLAGAALASGNVFVLQASASQLFQCRDRLFAALAATGPALVSVYSGTGGQTGGIAPYLLAAAATESRIFPSFSHDPAGANLASRFALDGNPQPQQDWPLHTLGYQDAACQRMQESVTFTVLDLLACDARFAGDFARIPPAAWNGDMVPAADCLGEAAVAPRLPYLLMLDGENRLHRVAVDERLMRTARRCRALWHGLQEMGGIRNSHAERAVAAARAAWEAEATPPPAAAQVPAAATASAEAPAAATSQTAAAAEPERSPDEPYIETARCSTCNECINLNGKMFAYNPDKQAYIADPNAGTYRQLVEAAESCQVAVIHPGKPRNPNEPGLEDLLARAAPFL